MNTKDLIIYIMTHGVEDAILDYCALKYTYKVKDYEVIYYYNNITDRADISFIKEDAIEHVIYLDDTEAVKDLNEKLNQYPSITKLIDSYISDPESIDKFMTE